MKKKSSVIGLISFHSYCIIWAVVMLNSCDSTVSARGMQGKNPTAYVFPFPIDETRQSILKMKSSPNSFKHMVLQSKEDSVFFSERARQVFSNPINSKDFYLHSFGSRIGKSAVYSIDGDFLDYYAEFHMHLLDKGDSTEIQIIACDCKVAVGVNLLPSLPHLVRSIKTQSVLPTTIEEYEILLMIGDALGVKHEMPKIIYPDTTVLNKARI